MLTLIFKNQNNLSEIGFYKIYPTTEGKQLFKNNSTFYQFHTEGFSTPSNCVDLAHGTKF